MLIISDVHAKVSLVQRLCVFMWSRCRTTRDRSSCEEDEALVILHRQYELSVSSSSS